MPPLSRIGGEEMSRIHRRDLPAAIESPASLRTPSKRWLVLATYLPLIITLLVAVMCPPAAAFASSAGGADDVNALALPSNGYSWSVAARSGKWIDVNLTKQRLTAYANGKAVFSTLVSTGTAATPTPTGWFRLGDHIRSKTLKGPGYYYPNVSYVMHFYGAYAIHQAYWHNNFGRRMSHGCVQLPTAAAARLYRWAPNGTPIYIHY
jgi:hypothetical protein